METNISVFIIGHGKLPKAPDSYTTTELNELCKQGIIEKLPLEDFIEGINTGISTSLNNTAVTMRFESPRKVICLKCGGTDVTCEAWINPNKQSISDVLDHYSDESFLFGCCESCGHGVTLTDVPEIQNDIDIAYEKFKEKNSCEPVYAVCEITFHSDLTTEEVNIKLTGEIEESDDDDYFFYCNGVEELKGLCEKTAEDFVVTRMDAFYKE